MPTQLTKSQLIEKIAEDTELGKKDVKAVIESMVTVGHKELKKTGVFLVPGFAKFVVMLYLPPDGKYFGSRESYGLTYTSCQESGKNNKLFASIGMDLGMDARMVRAALRE